MSHPSVDNEFGVAIDEIAVLFRSDAVLSDFITELVPLGWNFFNAAGDYVTTEPIHSDYQVQYRFLENPTQPYRLELMTLGGGWSPLHKTILWQLEMARLDAAIVHASFKLDNVNEMRAWCDELVADGLLLAQRCQSTYGMFEYWVDTKITEGSYLKPRVNLRDARQEDMMEEIPLRKREKPLVELPAERTVIQLEES
jgi:hypothetical protein